MNIKLLFSSTVNFNSLSLFSHGQAKDIMCDYKPGILENSAKMVLLFHLIEESVRKGDKLLVFRYNSDDMSMTRIQDVLSAIFIISHFNSCHLSGKGKCLFLSFSEILQSLILLFVCLLQSEFVHTDSDRGLSG